MRTARWRSGRFEFAFREVPREPVTGDYVSVGTYPFVLRPAVPGDLEAVRRLVREAATWLRTKGTDQWARPWPDPAGHRERILNDLLKGKTWIVWDGTTAAATITIDTDEPLDLNDQPVWPAHKNREPALYVRRVIVSRNYAGMKLGTGLLDWAAEVAQREHGAAVLRIDVWTTNLNLHAYYERRSFTRHEGRESRETADYPSQALFERNVKTRVTDYKKLFTVESGRA
jgi:GNAT superfamily N-acetyltransferase